MKNRRFLIPFATILCLLCAFLLSACGEEEPIPAPEPHTHTLTRHAPVEPTCETEGNLEYWECTDCGKYFTTADATAELADLSSLAIPVRHPTNAVVRHEAIAATCDRIGNSEYWECVACHKYYTDYTVTTEITDKTAVVLGYHMSTLIHHTPVAATCGATGNIEYWSCTVCAKHFSNATATAEITLDDTVTPATLQHSYDTYNFCTGCKAEMPHIKGLIYSLSNDSYTVTGIEADVEPDLIIPPYHDGKPVTAIAFNAFRDCTDLTSVLISSNVVSIGHHAFSGCTNLASVTFDEHSQLTKIDMFAFSDCHSLKLFEIPFGVTAIEDGTFERCANLLSVTIPASVTSVANGASAFLGCDLLEIYNFSSLDLSDLAMIVHTSATADSAIIIKDDYVFCDTGTNCYLARYWGADTELVLPNDCNGKSYAIYSAFAGCINVTNVVVPEGVTAIGFQAFYACANLSSISIPTSVTSIGEYAFAGCDSLTTVSFGENSQLTSIGDYAFCVCDSLTTITIPASVTSIGSYAFSYCYSLTTVSFGANSQLTSIGEDAFCGCNSLTTVSFGANSQLTSIGYQAFSSCSSLTTITIPASVTSIGYYAFSGCYKLIEVYNLSTLNITAGSSSNGYVGYYAKNVYTATTGEKKTFTDSDGYLFYDDGTNRYLLGYTGGSTALTLPASCKGNNYEIYQYAFCGRNDLTSVTIPASVTSIGEYAFNSCDSLTTVSFGANSQLTSIGSDAFRYCYKLIEVYNLSSLNIRAGSKDYGYVGYYAKDIYITTTAQSKQFTDSDGYLFYDDGTNRYLMGYTGDSTALTLPTSCKGNNYEIYQHAFDSRNDLTSVTIPASVTSIGDNAFYNCDSLTGVYITDMAAWCKISFGNSYANPLYYAGKLYLNENLVTDLVIPSTVTSIGSGAFYDCDSLTTITIPASVTSIGFDAFSGCVSLTTVSFGANSRLTSIGSYAFEYCDSLTTVSFGENSQLTSIGNGAFRYCSSLTTITIPASVTSIGSSAFSSCTGLIQKENGVSYVDKWVIDCDTSVTAVTLRADTVGIGTGAFYDCSSLTTITIPASVTSIGEDAFGNCRSLTTITIPASVTSIGYGAFCYCSSLTSVTFENPNGWWYASSADATSGTGIPAADLADPAKAAEYLTAIYCDHYWRCG